MKKYLKYIPIILILGLAFFLRAYKMTVLFAYPMITILPLGLLKTF